MDHIQKILRFSLILVIIIVSWNFYKTTFNDDLKPLKRQIDSLTVIIDRDRELYQVKLDSFKNFRHNSSKRIDSFIKRQKYHNWKFRQAIKSRVKNKQEYENNKDNITRSANSIKSSIRAEIR